MQIQKEEYNGTLYQMSLYSTGFLPGMSPRQRAERHKLTSEAKKTINAMQRRWRLMQLINANFVGGQDLFVCLTYADAPENEARCLQRFNRKIKTRFGKMDIEHAYVVVTTSHDMDDVPVRVHHHLIMRGALGAGVFRKLQGIIQDCWPEGVADTRVLREGADYFEDTAIYLLDQPTSGRAYSTSRNLKEPNEPVRLRLPEEEVGVIPPGVTNIERKVRDNEYGRFEYIVGRVYDKKLFEQYWAKQRKRAAPNPWERMQQRKRRAELQEEKVRKAQRDARFCGL